jgi:hypothetical protein
MADAAALIARLAALARRRPGAIASTLLIVSAVSLWVYTGVRGALVELAASNLRSQRAAEVITLDTWIGEKRLNVSRWAVDQRVVEATTLLLAAEREGADALRRACAGAPGAALIGAVDALRFGDAATSIHLVAPSGRLLAARDTRKCGHEVDAGHRARFAPVLGGDTTFTAPLDDEGRVGIRAGPNEREPKVWIAAPVRMAGGEPLAALDIGKPARERFASLFAALRSGRTGEAYAFDERGLLLTESRFDEALEQAGLIRRGESTILRVRLADPTAAGAPDALTRLVTQALDRSAAAEGERAGIVLDPYANYLGQRVVGAWQWLDAYDFGVAVEIGEGEALAPLRRLEQAFLVLALLVGTAVFGFIVALLRAERFRSELVEARRVGIYELFEEIGQGGVARVFRAQHRLLKRPTAVKIIELRNATDELLARFDREVRLTSQLMHPNTIEIFDYGRTPEGLPFYAMELLDGLTLQQMVERHGRFNVARTVHVLLGVAGSLSEAHARGLIHRDVTPANVMLCQKGGEYDFPKLLDFGLIKDIRTPHTRDLTRALRILGTPAYMAPERIERPDSADARSDLYAMGAVGFFLLTGRAPFAGDTDLALAYQVVNAPTPTLDGQTVEPVPRVLATLIGECLHKDPAQRPQSAAQVIETLDTLVGHFPWTNSDARAWWEAIRRSATAAAPAGA